VVVAGEDSNDPGQVGALLARRLSAAEVEVLDKGGVQARDLVQRRRDHGNRQVIRANVPQ